MSYEEVAGSGGVGVVVITNIDTRDKAVEPTNLRVILKCVSYAQM